MNVLAELDPIAATVVRALAWGVLESTIIWVAVGLWIRMLRPSATTRYVLRWTILGASLLLPLASIGSSLGRIEHVAGAQQNGVREFTKPRGPAMSARAAVAVKPSAPLANQVATAAPRAWEPVRASQASNGTPQAAFRRIGAWHFLSLSLVGIWLFVSGIRLTLLTLGLVALARIKRIARPLDVDVIRKLRRFRYEARSGRVAEIRVSDDVDVPVAIGFRRPAIVFPRPVVERESIADLDQIAMHEYAHIERYDDWSNLAQRAFEAVLWYHPVVAIIGRSISLERELACDDYVVAHTGRAHRYAACLWKLVESSKLPARSIVAPGALLSPKAITVRIEALLDSKRNALPRLSPLAAIGIGALGICMVVVEAQRAPAIADSSFAPAASRHFVAAEAISPRSSPAKPGPQPTPTPTPMPTVKPHVAAAASADRRFIFVRVDADATPQALASAIAREVSKRARTAYKATVERALVPLPGRKHVPRTTAGSGVPLSRADIERCIGCELRGADLHGLDLHGLTLIGADLRGADLHDANLAGTAFVGTNLRAANLTGADLHGASFSGCDLRQTSLERANLRGTRIIGTSVRGTNLRGTQMRSLIDRCSGCDFRGLDLRGQDLRGIVLEGADFRDVDLRNADLTGARLNSVDLRGVRLSGADLSDAVFVRCILSGVALGDATTTGASFETSDVGTNVYASQREAVRASLKAIAALHEQLGAFHDGRAYRREWAAQLAEANKSIRELQEAAMLQASSTAAAVSALRGAHDVRASEAVTQQVRAMQAAIAARAARAVREARQLQWEADDAVRGLRNVPAAPSPSSAATAGP